MPGFGLAQSLHFPTSMKSIAYGSGITPIARARLEERLAREAGRPLCLVWGPPGTGKHVLIERWLDSLRGGVRMLRWSKSGDGGDGFRSIESIDPGRAVDLSEIVGQWHEEVGEGTLVLDGCALDPDRWAGVLPEPLRYGPPKGMRLVLLARSRPRLPLERHLLAGTLCEIGAADLRLSRTETAQLLAATGISSLPSGAVEAIHRTACGWMAGIRLSSLHVRSSHDPELALGSLGENPHLHAYLEEELLGPLPDPLRRLATDLSVLHAPTSQRCDAVRERADSQGLLRQLADLVPFLEPKEEGRWELHPLVRTGLEERLRRRDPERFRALHRRAARWSLLHGGAEETVRHALEACDPETLEAVAERALQNLFRNSDFLALQRHVRDLPPSLARERPFLALFLAWALFHMGREQEGVRHLDRARELALESGMESSAPERYASILAHEAFLRSVLLRVEGRTDESIGVAEAGLAGCGTSRPFLATSFRAQIAIGQFLSGKTERARRGLESVVEESEPVAHHLAGFGAGYTLAEILMLRGRTDEVRRLHAHLLSRTAGGDGRDRPTVGYLEISRSRLHLLEGNLPDAALAAERGLSLGQQCDNIRILNYGLAARAEIAALSGDLDGAARALDEAEAVARRTRMHWAVDHDDLEARRMRLLLARLPGTAHHAWLARHLPALGAPSLPRVDAFRTAMRLLVCLGRGHDAVALGRRWRNWFRDEELLLPQLEAEYALALACEHLGREFDAVAHLDAAIRLGCALGVSGPFFHGPELDGVRRELLSAWMRSEGARDAACRALAARIGEGVTNSVAARPGPTGQGSLLSEREREVLRAIRDGKSNREIASLLFVAESTVKSHLKNIFAKLDVPNRTRAVALASDAGIL